LAGPRGIVPSWPAVSDSLALVLALCALAAALAAAVARPRFLPEAVVAPGGALVLVALGATTVGEARHAISELGSAVCFLAALLVLRGRSEHEVVTAAARADLLVLARDGDRGRPGPKSIGHAARFVLDHVTCRVLLI
jgi:hypothetical protein